jgi:single-strand DNA-binding protein
MLNHITIMGRLTRDPELRRTGSGVAVANFTVAVDRDFSSKDGGEKETDFIDCVAWRQTGEFVSKYFTKGSMAIVSGRLQIRNYTDKDNNKRRNAEVVADSVYFGDSKKSDQGNSTYQAPTTSNAYTGGFDDTLAYAQQLMARNNQSEFTMLEGDDAQLPF